MKKGLLWVVLMGLALTMQAGNVSVEWDRHSLIIDGKRLQ